MSEPPITRQAVHTSSGSNLPITRIVVHATCPDVGYPTASKHGAASGTAKYFQMASSGGSAHYITGIDSEEHCVKDSVVAWHAPPNIHSIGVEITADGGDLSAYRSHPEHAYTRDQWLSPEVWPAVVRAANRVKELCERFDVPKVRLSVNDLKAGKHGICGHVDVSYAFRQTDHSDPGPNFPWDKFMEIVTGKTTKPVPVVNKPPVSKPTTPVERPTLKPAPGPRYSFPLPGGYWFGKDDGTINSVSGAHPRTFMGHADDWWLKEFAKQLGRRQWDIASYLPSGNDGVFGDEYDNLVRAFQRDQKEVVDGKIGPQTWRAAFKDPIT